MARHCALYAGGKCFLPASLTCTCSGRASFEWRASCVRWEPLVETHARSVYDSTHPEDANDVALQPRGYDSLLLPRAPCL